MPLKTVFFNELTKTLSDSDSEEDIAKTQLELSIKSFKDALNNTTTTTSGGPKKVIIIGSAVTVLSLYGINLAHKIKVEKQDWRQVLYKDLDKVQKVAGKVQIWAVPVLAGAGAIIGGGISAYASGGFAIGAGASYGAARGAITGAKVAGYATVVRAFAIAGQAFLQSTFEIDDLRAQYEKGTLDFFDFVNSGLTVLSKSTAALECAYDKLGVGKYLTNKLSKTYCVEFCDKISLKLVDEKLFFHCFST